MSNDTNHQEHPTPTCPNCGGEKTRPLDRKTATCFDCDGSWRMDEETQQEVAPHWDAYTDTEQ